MNLELEGTRVLVTGGSSGLGFAVAQALVDEGARVALNARDTPRLAEASARLGAVAVPADLSTPDGPRRAVEQATRALGGLDCVLVNSGGPAAGDFASLDETTWQSAIDGTLLSTIRLLQHAVIELKSGVAPSIAVILVVIGPPADSRTHDLERPASRTRRIGEEPRCRTGAADPHQRDRAGPTEHRAPRGLGCEERGARRQFGR